MLAIHEHEGMLKKNYLGWMQVSGDSNGYAPADEAVNTTGPSRNVQRNSDGGYGAV